MNHAELIAAVRLHAGEGAQTDTARQAQREIADALSRVEAELVHWKEARQSAIDAGELMKAELAALKAEKLAREKQEPYCWYFKFNNGMDATVHSVKEAADIRECLDANESETVLYLAPGAGSVPMTEEQINKDFRLADSKFLCFRAGIRHAEAHHKIGVKP